MKRGKFQFTVRRWRRGSGGRGKREGFQDSLVLAVLFLSVMIHKSTLFKRALPPITWLEVILTIVCVFRIVFCFVYIDDGFNELSEYVIFEISPPLSPPPPPPAFLPSPPPPNQNLSHPPKPP